MNIVKRIFRWVAGIVIGLYLAITLMINIPLIQNWLANGVESILEGLTGANVSIGRVIVNWNGRLIVTDLMVDDLQGEEMLKVARVAARLKIRDLINKRIRIGNAQLFGMHANLYQECEGCDPNFKFLIDAFASKDTTKHTPLDLQISQLLVRRGNIKWEQRWKKDSDSIATKFNPSCIELSDLNVTAQLNTLTDDSLNLYIRRFDVKERSGLTIEELTLALAANKQGGTLKNFHLRLPHSNLDIPQLSVDGIDKAKKQVGHYSGAIKGHIASADFTPLVPKLAEVKNEVDIDLNLFGQDDNINIPYFYARDAKGQLRLSCSGNLDKLKLGRDSISGKINIGELHAETELLKPYVNSSIIERLISIDLNGTAAWAKKSLKADINARTPLGDVAVKGQGQVDGNIDATVRSSGFQLGELLGQHDLGVVALDVKANGTISKSPVVKMNGHITELDYKGYRYRNIELANAQYSRSGVDIQLASSDPNASFEVEGKADLNEHTYHVQANIDRLMPNVLNLTKKFVGTAFSGELTADLSGSQWDLMDGEVQLNDFAMTDTTGTYRPGDIHIKSRPEGKERNILLISPFLEAQVNGNFEPKVLVEQIKRMVSNYLPTDNNEIHSTSLETSSNTYKPDTEAEGEASFTLKAYSAEPLRKLLGVPLTLVGVTTAYGEMNSADNALWMNLTAPGIEYGKEHLRNVDLHLESNFESMVARLGLQRQMKGKWINLGLDTQGFNDWLTTKLFFTNDIDGSLESTGSKTYAGNVSVMTRLWKDADGVQGFEGRIQPSSLTLGDSVWSIHPGYVSYYDGVLQVDSFAVSQGDRFIHVDGRASKLESDTLHAELRRINLEYIFSLINFHAVELTGEATGHAYGHSLMSSPKADAYIRIPQFALNYGTMGDLDIHLNWGNRPYSIFLDGDIVDTPHEGRTLVKGYITPKKDIDYHGIDLNVNATHVNLEFINKWTSTIFDDLQGRATGWVRIFGPFKGINIEGDAVVEQGSVGIPFTEVRYHLVNDTVQLRPDNIYFYRANLYDPQGNPGIEGHNAVVNGHLHHDNFKNMTYNISIDGNNILGYDFRELGDQNFFGTVYATGNVSLKGHPRLVRIGIKAHPERGTTFTYNATSPDKLTDTPFITYKKKSEIGATDYNYVEKASETATQTTNAETSAVSSELYIDFDLDIDEQSTMNLLMDTRSGDKITLNGAGHILAHYYNKGAFDLFGTYRVNRGTYNLSLQEFIHKNFEFSPDGTITFNGEPYDGDLNLQAVHTVNGVSLNDINPKANFSNTTTRVNCLMNIGGKARAPRITFDFDIPNANEEEKQMVRSLISTEEERNMQVVYLLGIGRFYAYDYSNENQTQGTMAMNSLLSSTLSSTINQALSSMIGSRNWNVGANLRTGEMGWSDMDVEGMLQGNLLNNRLLINGNFGYRDNPIATSNFIGDFDVKYLLTRTGSVALKAYSETNDRYFTKSSLTTQGIGVLLKKDFTSWSDLWTKRKNKTKKQNK